MKKTQQLSGVKRDLLRSVLVPCNERCDRDNSVLVRRCTVPSAWLRSFVGDFCTCCQQNRSAAEC